MWKLAIAWLHRTWWGMAVSCAVLVFASYLAIWQVIEPVQELFDTPPDLLQKRAFYHVVLALLIGSHASVLLELIRRRRLWVQANPMSIETGVISSTDTPVESEQPKLKSEQPSADVQRDESVDAAARLVSYEKLEREIVGILASGDEISIKELPYRLGIGGEDAARSVRLAVANPFETGRVVGTGGPIPRLKIGHQRQTTPA